MRFTPANRYFREMTRARVGHPDHKTFCSFLSPDLLVLDNLGLHRLDEQQSIDLCELAFAVAAVLGLVPDSHQPDKIRLVRPGWR